VKCERASKMKLASIFEASEAFLFLAFKRSLKGTLA
jgi:hypothetical protein